MVSSLRVCDESAALPDTYVLDNHDEERKLDGKSLLGLDGASDEVGGNVGAHDLENGGLNISIGQTLDVTVSHVLVPDLERLGSAKKEKDWLVSSLRLALCFNLPDGVKDGEETALVGRLEHRC